MNSSLLLYACVVCHFQAATPSDHLPTDCDTLHWIIFYIPNRNIHALFTFINRLSLLSLLYIIRSFNFSLNFIAPPERVPHVVIPTDGFAVWKELEILKIHNDTALHDARAVCRVGVDILLSHLSVFRLRIVLSSAALLNNLLIEREWIGEHAETLLQLPTARFTNRLSTTNGFRKHESANDSKELHECNRERTGGNEHRTLGDDFVEHW